MGGVLTGQNKKMIAGWSEDFGFGFVCCWRLFYERVYRSDARSIAIPNEISGSKKKEQPVCWKIMTKSAAFKHDLTAGWPAGEINIKGQFGAESSAEAGQEIRLSASAFVYDQSGPICISGYTTKRFKPFLKFAEFSPRSLLGHREPGGVVSIRLRPEYAKQKNGKILIQCMLKKPDRMARQPTNAPPINPDLQDTRPRPQQS